jgi:hypothetical protein
MKKIVALSLMVVAGAIIAAALFFGGSQQAKPAQTHPAAVTTHHVVAVTPSDTGFSSTCIGTVCTTSGHFVQPALPTTHLVSPDPVSAAVLIARGPSCSYVIGNGPAVNCEK